MMQFEKTDDELGYLMYVELPNVINRIMQLSYLGIPKFMIEYHEEIANNMKRLSNVEIDSALEKITILNKKNGDLPDAISNAVLNSLQDGSRKG